MGTMTFFPRFLSGKNPGNPSSHRTRTKKSVNRLTGFTRNPGGVITS